MKTRAAVAWEAGKPLEIETLDLEWFACFLPRTAPLAAKHALLCALQAAQRVTELIRASLVSSIPEVASFPIVDIEQLIPRQVAVS